jgi:hypothetical protein
VVRFNVAALRYFSITPSMPSAVSAVFNLSPCTYRLSSRTESVPDMVSSDNWGDVPWKVKRSSVSV